MARLSAGPFWLGTNSDPSYLYLFNSSYILDGIAPMFTDHPGTTLQLLLAGILSLFGPFSSEMALVSVTAACAEQVLSLAWGLILVLNVISSWWLGSVVWRVTGRLSAAFAGQVMGMIFLLVRAGSMPYVANVNAEALLIPLMNVYFSVLLLSDKERSLGCRAPFSLGVVAGACVVTKMTFLPLLLVPLFFLGPWRRALVYIAGFFLSVPLLTIPIWSRLEKWWGWTAGLMLKTGAHGSGENGILIPGVWFRSLGGVITHDVMVFVLAAAAFGLSFRGGVWQRWLRVLSVMIALQAVFVAKQGGAHYMVPALAAAGVLAALLMLWLSDRRILTGLIVGGLVFFSVTALIQQAGLRAVRDDLLAFSARVRREAGNGLLAGAYRASSPQYAIFFGHSMHYYKGAGVYYFRPYGPVLAALYPEVYTYDYWVPCFYSFRGRASADQLWLKFRRIFVHSAETGRFSSRYFQEVDTSKTGEKLYQLR